MKVVFLTLLLGLVCAAQEEDATDAAKSSTISEPSGQWSTTYIASSSLAKASQKVFLMPHRIYIVFCKNCFVIMFFIYDCNCHVWRPFFICGELIKPYIYKYEYNGTNTIEFIHVSEKALVAINVNADETGKKTQQVLLFGKENDVDKEGLEIFKKETLSRKISEENIKDLTEPDKCLAVA
ncbi:odorant-binding protein-like isoform X2 [Ovis aries]|uniref:odorant-binding protein-like isoform X2 n=1 Tax=Ovis aries TaxID=9940 RepID=UPI00100E8BEE|nr:odorant-binding protein-like isoform X2 [Ovis aries]XP_060263227.1 odorant-binding protein-like isoform X2 [Ovis aries]